MGVVAIDFETANERRDSPCSIGLAFVEDGQVVERRTRLIRPREMRFAPGNVRVHGLTPADVAHAPEFPEVIGEFADRLAGALVIAHYAAFDIGVLGATLALYGMPQPRLAYACTVGLARAAWPGLPRYGLAALAERCGIRFRHHDAGEDADACARIALMAAAAAGAADIAAMATRHALVRHRPAAPGFPARDGCSIAARALRAARGEPPSSAPPRFVVRGRSGNRYDITLDDAAGSLACTCAAARFRRPCRHVTALLCGDVTDLVAGDPAALARVLAAA